MTRKSIFLIVKKWPGDVIALLAGGLLTLAFSPGNIFFLTVISPALLLLVLVTATIKRSFFRGWLFGLAFFGTGAYWIFISIHVYSETSVFLALNLTFIFIAFLSLFPAILGTLTATFNPDNPLQSKVTSAQLLLVFPAIWVLLEWIRAWFLTGFPWLFLGYSLSATPLKGLAPLIGVYGLSWVLAFIAGLIVYTFFHLKRGLLSLMLVSLLLGIASYTLNNKQWTQNTGEPMPIALVQANIDQADKWKPEYFLTMLYKHEHLSEPYWTSNQIVIWPENAIPLAMQDGLSYLTELTFLAQENNTTLITGIPIRANDPETFYNALLVLGENTGLYQKYKLVPFGEFLPFEHYLRGLINFFDIPMSTFVPGKSSQPLLTINGMQFSPTICYEVAYPNMLNDIQDANVLLNISDTSWFGHSIANQQMLQMARFHAVATGRYMITATNSGVSAIISPHGELDVTHPPFEEGVMVGEVRGVTGSTPLMRLGNGPILLFIGFLLVFGVLWIKFINRKK